MGSTVNHSEEVFGLKSLLQIVSFAVEREDRQTDRQTDRQRDRETERQSGKWFRWWRRMSRQNFWLDFITEQNSFHLDFDSGSSIAATRDLREREMTIKILRECLVAELVFKKL